MASSQNVVNFADYVSKAYKENVKTPKPKKVLLREPKCIGERGDERMYLYVLQTGPFVKIGISANLVQRADHMDALNPIEPTLLLYRTMPRNIAQLVEKRIHGLMSQYHHKREWFRLPPMALLRETIKHALNEGWVVHRLDWRLENAVRDAYAEARALGIKDHDEAWKMVVGPALRAAKKAMLEKYEWS
jgi:hypothetical protein